MRDFIGEFSFMAHMYYNYGGAPSPVSTLSPALRRMSEKERKEFQRHRAHQLSMMKASPGSMNINLEKYVKGFSSGKVVNPIEFDAALDELEEATDRMLELRHEAQLKWQARQDRAKELAIKAQGAAAKKKEKVGQHVQKYLEKMETVAPFRSNDIAYGWDGFKKSLKLPAPGPMYRQITPQQ